MQLNINGNIYLGKPLKASTFDGKYWAGNSNFLSEGGTDPDSLLKDLEDCFVWMKTWAADSDYRYGYVLDFESKTIYYDKQKCLDHLNENIFPRRNLVGYFEFFVQRSFSE